MVLSNGIQLKNFRKNPVVLFAHNAGSPPIGKASRVEKGEGFVDADVDFFGRDTFEFADTIFRIVDAGGLKATSIGFIPMDWESLEPDGPGQLGIEFQKIDLLEFSIVPIPANPEAVARALEGGASMKPYLNWLDDIQDNWDATKFVMEAFGIGEEQLTREQP